MEAQFANINSREMNSRKLIPAKISAFKVYTKPSDQSKNVLPRIQVGEVNEGGGYYDASQVIKTCSCNKFLKDLQRMLQSKALLIDSRTHLCELYLFKEESYDGIYIIFSVKTSLICWVRF